jgi:cardiolipin synthase A/B
MTLMQLALSSVSLAAAATAGSHAVIYKREPRSAAIWVIIIALMPLAGPVLYFILGINRVERRAASLREDMVRHRTQPDVELRDLSSNGAAPHLVPIARLVRQVVARPLLPGNQIDPLVCGVEAYPAMLAAIDDAQESVGFASYIFHGISIGEQFVESLRRATERGVAVRVLIDDVDARFSRRSAVTPLRHANVPVAIFNPTLVPARLKAANLRNHRKILVTDGRVGFTGGMNVDEEYWNPDAPEKAYRDLQFRLRGPVVAHLSEVFVDDWNFSTGEQLRGAKWFPKLDTHEGSAFARGIESGPDEAFDRARWAIIAGLDAAQRSVRVFTPYFIPDAALISALNAAAMRGVEVDIFLPQETDLPHVHWAAFAQLWQVLEHGCRIWLSPGPFDHSKLMVVDAAWTLLGSANWDTRSLRLNFEFNVECYDATLGAQLERLANDRRDCAQQLTLERVNGRSFPIKLRDGTARLFAPYL